MGNTPEIRFKGFTDDWEQRKVTELGEIYIGLVTTMTAHYTNEGTLLIRNSDIKDGKFAFDTEPIYLDKEFAEQNKSRKHKIGDVITVHTGDVGTSAVIAENEANSIGFATIVTRPNKELLDSYYLATFLNTEKHKTWAVQMSTGDGRTNYNLRDYTELVIPVPKLEEQKKIANCISNLNTLITLHQRKCDETKKLKKYMLQKMFPQKGEKNPEIRFAGFTDDWEQRKLGEVTQEFKSGNALKSDEISITGKYPVYGGNGLRGYTLNYNHDGEFALIGRQGALCGNMNYSAGKAYFTEHAVVVEADSNNNTRFLYYMLNTMNLGQYSDQSAQPGLAVNKLIKLKNFFPEKSEQIKIGAYFSNLDHLITLHQCELEKLKNFKKFMLRKMFV